MIRYNKAAKTRYRTLNCRRMNTSQGAKAQAKLQIKGLHRKKRDGEIPQPPS